MPKAFRKNVRDIQNNELNVRISILSTFNNREYPVIVRLRTNDEPRKELLKNENKYMTIEDFNDAKKKIERFNEFATDILNQYNVSISGWEQVDYPNRFNTNW